MSKLVSGGGGGKPALAMGGGTDSSRIQDALAHGLELVKEACKKFAGKPKKGRIDKFYK